MEAAYGGTRNSLRIATRLRGTALRNAARRTPAYRLVGTSAFVDTFIIWKLIHLWDTTQQVLRRTGRWGRGCFGCCRCTCCGTGY